MNIKDILNGIVHYYDSTRRVGHTTATLGGAIPYRATVVAHSFAGQKSIESMIPYPLFKTASIFDFGTEYFRGRESGPIVFDNAAIYEICSRSVHQIEKLEREKEELRTTLEDTQLKLLQIKSIVG